MKRSTLLLAAAAVDLLFGDPEVLPHPVRLIGTAITQGETLLYPRQPTRMPVFLSEVSPGVMRDTQPKHPDATSSPIPFEPFSPACLADSRPAFLAGVLLTATIVGTTFLLARKVLGAPAQSASPHKMGHPIHPRRTLEPCPTHRACSNEWVRNTLTILLAATTLAARNLDDEARPILHALAADNLPEARTGLARIVGRDTQTLAPAAIHRALIETLAESLADGIVAPLFFLALGGVPLALAFKAVSTLDSMIGHRTPRYLYFGRAAARLDDVASFFPARIAAALLLIAGRASSTAFRAFLRDRRNHASPNAGHPEAAMAALLRVQLGGYSTYAGEPHHAPLLNPGAPLPTLADARRALRLTRMTALITTLAFAAACFFHERRCA